MVDTLIGREWHLRILRTALDELRAGSGAAVALAGDPGIGKSALSHLRQIYRKLDVPNRAALTRALLDTDRA